MRITSFVFGIGAAILLSIPVAQAAQICSCRVYQNGICYDQSCYDNARGNSSSRPTTTSTTHGLKLTITASEDEVDAGDTVTFTIRLRNTTSRDIETNVLAELDSDMEFVSTTDGGDDDDDEVEWDDIEVDAGESETISLRVRIDNNADDGDELTLRVEAGNVEDEEEIEVTNDNEYCDDYYSDCDDDDDNGDEDIRITITDDQDPVRAGDTLTYRIDLHNRENATQSVGLRAFLDSDTTFVSASDSGTRRSSTEVEWRNIRLSGGQTRVITLRVLVRSGVSNGSTLSLRAESGDGYDSETTRISSSGTGGNNSVCTYYNAYLRQNYSDYCDDRHEYPRNR